MEVIKAFSEEKMEIEQEIVIQDAFHLGDGKNRSIMIKLKHLADKAVIFTNASKLNGKVNKRNKAYFIQDDRSDVQAEQRKVYRELQRENKELDKEKQLKIKMARGKILVNNEVVKQKIKSPTYAEILQMDEKELEKICAVKLVAGPEHIEKGSEYFEYMCKVKNLQQIQNAYYKMHVKHADATHISCAYRLEDPIGPYRQQGIDDGDAGVDRSLLKTLKDANVNQICIFLVRYYGQVHLGKRRFEIAESITERSVQRWFTKNEQFRRKTDRRLSQVSVSSAITNYDSQEEEEIPTRPIETAETEEMA